MESIFKREVDNDYRVINKIKLFFDEYIKKCGEYSFFRHIQKIQNASKLEYLYIIKMLITEKMIEYFEKWIIKIKNKIENKRNMLRKIMKNIFKNLVELKKSVEMHYNLEKNLDVYNNWIKEAKTLNEKNCTINTLKEYITNYIEKPLNLEMNYTQEPLFCLWAIKNGFAKYFFD